MEKSRPYILSECHWGELKQRSIELAILPWGATEAHNYHLPYGTDNYEAEGIVEEAAKEAYESGADLIVLPTIPFGVNTGQADILLDINLNPSTQQIILSDIIEVLNRQGIKKLLIFNGHGGNDFKMMLRELGLTYPDMFLCETSWFKMKEKYDYFEEHGDHADEMETSLMMYLQPGLVKPLASAGTGAQKQWKIKSIQENWVWAERRWSQISADTGVGDPSKSTVEKGKAFFTYTVGKFSTLFQELCAMDVNDMYQ